MLQPERHEEEPSGLQPFADNFIPVIPVTYTEHTPEHPFCRDETCPCHEDQAEIAVVNEWVQQGLMSPENARAYVMGRTL